MFELRKNPKHPVIYKPMYTESTKIAVQIPYVEGMRQELKDALAGGHVDFLHSSKMWEMSSKHTETIAEFLKVRFGKVELQIVTSTLDLCTVPCQRADPASTPVSECVCVCGGHGHAGGWPEGWKLASTQGELLVKGERKTEIFTLSADAGEVFKPKTKAAQKPQAVHYVSSDPYMDYYYADLAEQDRRFDNINSYAVGHIFDDGVEVVWVEPKMGVWGPERGVMQAGYKTLEFPDGHNYLFELLRQTGEYDH
jgi:hypothetical protein